MHMYLIDNLVEAVKQAGVVGAGGAGFPTHIKLQSRVDTVIGNGCECEPLLKSDGWLMTEHPEDVIRGLLLAMEATGAEKGIIAVKEKNKDAINALDLAIRPYPRLRLFPVGNYYPIGDEHLLTYEVTGNPIPIGGIPLDVGVLVQNVTTLANIEAAAKGTPVLEKTITVIGAVRSPGLYRVPVGTSVGFVLESAGGPTVEKFRVIEGGPMMGKPVELNQPITKTSSGLLILADNHPLVIRKIKPRKSPRYVCCNCSECSFICPRSLLGHPLHPHKIMRNFKHGFDHPELTNALLCSECALCEAYACVMDLSPLAVNRDIKISLAAKGIKYHGRRKPEVCSEREFRKVPAGRLLQRLQLAEYRLGEDPLYRTITPCRVIIPLKQHIGAPAHPVVNVGDRIKKGDVIGETRNKISARVHAGIAGIVETVGESITIKAEA